MAIVILYVLITFCISVPIFILLNSHRMLIIFAFTIGLILLSLFTSTYFVNASSLNKEPVPYYPIIQYRQIPESPVPVNSEVKIYAHVEDKYGEVVNSSLSYGDCHYSDESDSTKIYNVEMKLINGTLTNGTFLGVIPPMDHICDSNMPINYTLNFADNLNYKATFTDSYFSREDSFSPEISNLYADPTVSEEATVYVADMNSGIENVTFSYSFSNSSSLPSSLAFDENYYDEVSEMELIEGDMWNATYKATLPTSLHNNTFFICKVEAIDKSGNKYDSHCPDKQIMFKPLSKDAFFDIRIMNVNLENQSFKYNLRMVIPEVNSSIFDDDYYSDDNMVIMGSVSSEPELWVRQFEDFSAKTLIPFNRLSSNNLHSVQAEAIAYEKYYGLNYNSERNGLVDSLSMEGTPSLYPFDYYYVDLGISLPITDLDYKTYSEYMHGSEEEWTKHWIFFEDPVFEKWNPILKSVNIPSKDDQSESSMNFVIEFYRNHHISIIIIPLIAIFFLLGAIFIFNNASENIGNRLTLTLGIFALIFTLPEIIDSMKPQVNVPTIADAMLSTIILTTIVFTVSSIITSNSSIQRKFPNYYHMGNIISFIVASAFVILSFYTFPIDINIWLVPIMIFGFGYGLLLRTFKLLNLKNIKKLSKYVVLALLFISGALFTLFVGSVMPFYFLFPLSDFVSIIIYCGFSFTVRSLSSFFIIRAAQKYILDFGETAVSLETSQYNEKSKRYSKNHLFLISCIIMGIITQVPLVNSFVKLITDLLKLFHIDIQYFQRYFSIPTYDILSLNLGIFFIIDLTGLLLLFMISKGVVRRKMIKEIE